MYFFSRHNKFYSFAISIKPFYRYVLTCVVIGFLGYGWLYGMYFPLEKITLLHRQEVDEMHNKNVSLKHEQRKLKELESLLHEIESSHQSYSSKSRLDFNDKIQSIFDYAQKSGLTINAFNIDQKINKEWYEKEIIQTNFSGTLDQTLHFFASIAASNSMISCKNVHLTKQQDDTFSIDCQLDIILVS